jgi:flagellar secretion chaperone FliS
MYSSTTISYGNAAGAASHYRAQKVVTLTPAELIGMLYDGATAAIRTAITATAEGNVAEAHRLLIKAQDIVMELRCSLNLEEGGDLAQQLDDLYTFLYGRLVHANLRKDTRVMERCLTILQPLQEGWRQACLGQGTP